MAGMLRGARRLGVAGLWVITWVAGARAALAQSSDLQPGDVAVTCVDTRIVGGHNHFQITPLVPLPAAVDPYQLQYTDLEADRDGSFNDFNENVGDISPGAKRAGEPALIEVDGLEGPNEQVFLFQGVLDPLSGSIMPSLIWGFQMSTAGGWVDTRIDDVSALPDMIRYASVGVRTDGATSFAYTGPTTGTRPALQAAIANATNWTAGASCPTGFTITEATDAGGADAGVDSADAPSDVVVSLDTGGASDVASGLDVAEERHDGGPGEDSGVDQAVDRGIDTGTGGLDGAAGVDAIDAGGSDGVRDGSAADGDAGAADGGGHDGLDARDASADGGAEVRVDASGDGGAHPTSSGCNCSAAGGDRSAPLLAGFGLALALALASSRKRRAPPRGTSSDRPAGRGA